MFHALQLKPTVCYDGSNANAADVPVFCPAADELGEYKVEIFLIIALAGVVALSVQSTLSSGVGTRYLSRHGNRKLN